MNEIEQGGGQAALTRWQRIKANRGFRFAVLFVFVNLLYGVGQNLMGILAGVKAARADHLSRAALHDMTRTRAGLMHLMATPFGGGWGLGLIVLAFAIILAGGWLYVRVSRALERRTVTEFSGPHCGGRYAAGALLGLGLMSASVWMQHLLGDADIVWNGTLAISVITVLPVTLAPMFEELAFRGVGLRMIEESWGSGVALFITSLFFGLAHLTNANSGLMPSLSITVEAGLLLGMAYIASRTLWLPMGVHFGWNFTEGDIWGTPDSGNAVPGFFTTTTHGNALITGGAFGPEASIITPLLCLVATVVLYRMAVQRGYWQAFRNPFARRVAA
ncbi:MAG: CPBP family intramembrane metalloprotease [Alphaproteobacteria bacterium]|nr:CPBP family intramembrane metalloprotease [Alphaproteobacteria bacterium]MDE2341211.1 CPBP family intramembrane metalloprotease [Alphaproteobacteria bacterium]